MVLIDEIYQIFKTSSGICTDTRKIEKNQLYFALKGEHFDGNKFVMDALARGCIAAITDDQEFPDKKGIIKVNNSLSTLQELARYHRKQLKIPVLAITGSNGKTTTKELLYNVLSKKIRVLATAGNFNNHIGVPLTLLRLKNEEFAIIEMGANHLGEIDALCRIAEPDYGIITNIGKAHLEGFGSFEGVKKAKGELYAYLHEKKGTIFINGSNDILTSIANSLSVSKYSYVAGENVLCDGYVSQNGFFPEFMIKFMDGGNHFVQTRLSGSYNLENYLAAACIGKFFKVKEQDIIDALSSYQPNNNRSELLKTTNNQLLLDAYNANPTSMKESLSYFISLRHPDKMIILGDMLELGEYSQQEHKKILKYLSSHQDTKVYLIGNEFSSANAGFSFSTYQNTEAFIEHLHLNPVKDQLILLKGSRGLQLEKLIEVL